MLNFRSRNSKTRIDPETVDQRVSTQESRERQIGSMSDLHPFPAAEATVPNAIWSPEFPSPVRLDEEQFLESLWQDLGGEG